jgi:hypothetical protein
MSEEQIRQISQKYTGKGGTERFSTPYAKSRRRTKSWNINRKPIQKIKRKNRLKAVPLQTSYPQIPGHWTQTQIYRQMISDDEFREMIAA